MTQDTEANPPQKGPIVITQITDHYLVRIPVSQGDRARKISNYQWDGTRKMWIYPKTSKSFDALEQEFKADADVFALQRPIIDPPINERKINIEQDPEELEEASPEGEHVSADLLGQIPQMIHGIEDNQESHDRKLQDILIKQDEITQRLSEIEIKSGKVSKETKIVTKLPGMLDLGNSEHLELFERALILVAYLNAQESKSFKNWIFCQSPLKSPSEFVSNTHEHLKSHLEKITGKNQEAKFWELVKEIKIRELIFCEDNKDYKEVFQQLQNLTNIRNKFSHLRKPMSQPQKVTLAITYLMDLSSLWTKVVVEDENETELSD